MCSGVSVVSDAERDSIGLASAGRFGHLTDSSAVAGPGSKESLRRVAGPYWRRQESRGARHDRSGNIVTARAPQAMVPAPRQRRSRGSVNLAAFLVTAAIVAVVVVVVVVVCGGVGTFVARRPTESLGSEVGSIRPPCGRQRRGPPPAPGISTPRPSSSSPATVSGCAGTRRRERPIPAVGRSKEEAGFSTIGATWSRWRPVRCT